MRTSKVQFLAVVALAAVALAACSSSSKASSTTTPTTTAPVAASPTTAASGGGATPKTTVAIASTKYGKILVDSKGETLYTDKNDKPGNPACTGQCLAIWPPVVAPASPTYAPGLTASKYSSVTLSDGTKQLTVSGSPLYTFAGKAPGDVSGQAVNGFYVVMANGA
jgi:predicted lipoprotein with Yx(FWY)xxD motif